MCMLNHFSHIWLCATLWTVACQDPLSMGFSMQDYLRRLSCPPAGDLPDPEIEPKSLISNLLWQAVSLPLRRGKRLLLWQVVGILAESLQYLWTGPVQSSMASSNGTCIKSTSFMASQFHFKTPWHKWLRFVSYFTSYIVSESGVWVLTTQKALKRPDWWKGRFALLWMPAISREGRFLFKNWLPPLTIVS